ncbi:MAG: hypothetical protein V8T87_04870 [Victivallales bacterium]
MEFNFPVADFRDRFRIAERICRRFAGKERPPEGGSQTGAPSRAPEKGRSARLNRKEIFFPSISRC